MDKPEVQELVKYCKELEDEVIKYKQDKTFSKEKEFIEFLTQLVSGIDNEFKTDKENKRWPDLGEPVDFKESMENLQKNIGKWLKEYKIKL